MQSSVMTDIALWVFNLGSTVVWILAGIIGIYVIIYSAVFFYHWYKFSVTKTFSKVTVLVYTAGTLALISTMITAAVYVQ